MKKVNPINEIYGKLKVISEHSKTRNGHYRYTCLCECGNYTNVLLTHLRQNNTKSCGCDKPIGKTHSMWEGIGEISGNFWYNHIVRNAKGEKKRKVLELSITKEYIWELFLIQDRKCKLSGLELKFPISNKDRNYNASLDRIDSTKGYIEGNVQWVERKINIIKREFNQQDFIEMCNKIVNYANQQPS